MPAAYTYLQHNTKRISYAVFQFFLSEKNLIEKIGIGRMMERRRGKRIKKIE